MSDLPTDPHAEPLFFNRELSWLDFNARVLHEAEDARTPLLERLKFLAIVSRNLDEFYMVRVAGLRRQVALGVTAAPPDGMSPRQQLEAIDARVRAMTARQHRCLEALLPALAEHGVRLLEMAELSTEERDHVARLFETQLYPVLTPLAVDPGHPFPYISNLSLSLAVRLRHPETGEEHFARVKVPQRIMRWVPTGRPHRFVPVERVLGASLAVLFPGMELLGWHGFRITRYSDLDLSDAEEPEDLLRFVEDHVFRRRFSEVVRLEVQADMPEPVRAMLLAEFRADLEDAGLPSPMAHEVHEMPGLLDLGDLLALSRLELPELRDPLLIPATPAALRGDASVLDVIAERDLLVHHPFESFSATVERFVQEAARDERVLAIKLMLYRTSGDAAVVRALTEAAQRGKEVTVLVELRARFEETNNIAWARTLADFGIHVVYGHPHLKTHANVALGVRREAAGIRRYVHVGTGTYNSTTARLYTDLGLFTGDEAIGADASALFNQVTGFSTEHEFRTLIVAPRDMRARFIALIEAETEHARAGRPAVVVAKMNALVDADVIRALYWASQAGVEIDLIVRGICCLRPGVPGLSERVRVRSIVGRFLEHSRLWHFGNGGTPIVLLGSADWMPRNFERRVEAVAPVTDPRLRDRLLALLDRYLADNRHAWELAPDGTWTQCQPGPHPAASAQDSFLAAPWGAPSRT